MSSLLGATVRWLVRFVAVMIAGLGAAVFAQPPAPAFACTCGGTADAQSMATLIFEGDVIARGPSSGRGPVYSRQIEFRVISVERGTADHVVDVATSEVGARCGFPFRDGRRYRVYATVEGIRSGSRDPDAQRGWYATNSCMGNVDLGPAGPLLVEIVASPEPPLWQSRAVVAGGALVLAGALVGGLLLWRRRSVARPTA